MPAGQDEISRAALRQQTRNLQAERAGAAGDQVCPVRTNRALLPRVGIMNQHDLPEVLGLRHEPERADRVSQMERVKRQRLQIAAGELLEQAREDRSNGLAIAAEVDRVIRNIGPTLCDSLGRPDRVLAEFQEPAARTEHRQTALDEFSCERIEHDVDALAVGARHHLVGKLKRARAQDVLDADRFEIGALDRAANGRVHLGAGLLGQLDGGKTDASCGRMNQDAVAGRHVRQLTQPVCRRHERDWNRGGLLDAQVRRLPEHELRGQGNGASERPRPERHHLVTNRPLRDAATDRRDAADAFVSKRTGGPLIRPERIQDVAEVEAGRLDLDLDFAGSGRLAVARLQGQAVEQARLSNLELHRVARARAACQLPGTHAGEAPHVAAAVAIRHVRFALRCAEFVHHVRGQLTRAGFDSDIDQRAPQLGMLEGDRAREAGCSGLRYGRRAQRASERLGATRDHDELRRRVLTVANDALYHVKQAQGSVGDRGLERATVGPCGRIPQVDDAADGRIPLEGGFEIATQDIRSGGRKRHGRTAGALEIRHHAIGDIARRADDEPGAVRSGAARRRRRRLLLPDHLVEEVFHALPGRRPLDTVDALEAEAFDARDVFAGTRDEPHVDEKLIAHVCSRRPDTDVAPQLFCARTHHEKSIETDRKVRPGLGSNARQTRQRRSGRLDRCVCQHGVHPVQAGFGAQVAWQLHPGERLTRSAIELANGTEPLAILVAIALHPTVVLGHTVRPVALAAKGRHRDLSEFVAPRLERGGGMQPPTQPVRLVLRAAVQRELQIGALRRDDGLHDLRRLVAERQRFDNDEVVNGDRARVRDGRGRQRHLEQRRCRHDGRALLDMIGQVRRGGRRDLRLELKIPGRRVEPVAEQRMYGAARSAIRRLPRRCRSRIDPEAAPLERIRRHGQRTAPVVSVDAAPVDVATRDVQATEAFEHLPPVVASLAERRQPDGRVVDQAALAKTRQRRPWSDFQEDCRAQLLQCAHRLGKLHGAAHVCPPVRGRREVPTHQPSRDVRDEGEARRCRRHAGGHLLEVVQHRLHQVRVKRVRDGEGLGSDAPGLDSRDRVPNGRTLPRDNNVVGRIDCRDRDGPVRDQIEDLRLAREHGTHGAPRGQRLNESSSCGHERERVLEAQNSRDAGRDVFADTVPENGGRFDAPRAPQLRERVLNREKRRLRVRRLIDRRIHAWRRIQDRQEGAIQMAVDKLRASIERAAEGRLGVIQLPAHADVLGSLPGEEERHFRAIHRRGLSFEDTGSFLAAGSRLQHGCGLLSRFSDHHEAIGELRPAGVGRVADVGQRQCRLLRQMLRNTAGKL